MATNLTVVEDAAMMFNAEAEAALCGAMMSDAKIIDQIADKLSADDFGEPLFGRIFAAIVHEHSLGRAATPVTLIPLFANDEGMKHVGGAGEVLANLTGSGVVVGAVPGNTAHILALARKRRLVEAMEGVLALAAESGTELEALIAEAESALSDAADDDKSEEHISAGAAAARVLDTMHDDRHAGFQSGIGAIDTVLGAIQPKNLVILAARPAMGKTATAISYALGAASRGHGVLFISHEMSADEIAERALADMCFDSSERVPFTAITSGRINADQGRQLARAAEGLEQLPLTIIDVGPSSIGKISRLVRRHKRRFAARGHKLNLVIVDYLQLVRSDHREKDRYTTISEVSLGLKQIAKTQDVGLLALCQLSREVEKRQEKRPMLADLRDSGSIEQDADSVLFLMRPEYYIQRVEPDKDDAEHAAWELMRDATRNVIEFICAKRRRGSEGMAKGKFYGAYQAVRS